MLVVSALVSVEPGLIPVGKDLAAALDRRHRVPQWFDEHAVVPVRGRDQNIERQPVRVDEQAVFAADLSAVRAIRLGQRAPLSLEGPR